MFLGNGARSKYCILRRCTYGARTLLVRWMPAAFRGSTKTYKNNLFFQHFGVPGARLVPDPKETSRDPPGTTPGIPRDPPGIPQGSPRDSQGLPRDPPGNPQGPPREHSLTCLLAHSLAHSHSLTHLPISLARLLTQSFTRSLTHSPTRTH